MYSRCLDPHLLHRSASPCWMVRVGHFHMILEMGTSVPLRATLGSSENCSETQVGSAVPSPLSPEPNLTSPQTSAFGATLGPSYPTQLLAFPQRSRMLGGSVLSWKRATTCSLVFTSLGGRGPAPGAREMPRRRWGLRGREQTLSSYGTCVTSPPPHPIASQQ